MVEKNEAVQLAKDLGQYTVCDLVLHIAATNLTQLKQLYMIIPNCCIRYPSIARLHGLVGGLPTALIEWLTASSG